MAFTVKLLPESSVRQHLMPLREKNTVFMEIHQNGGY